MTETVTLKNRQKRMVSYNYDLAVYKGADRVVRTEVSTSLHNPRTGEKSLVQKSRNVANSITFLPEEKKEDLHPSIMLCPQVAAAIASRELEVVATKKDQPAAQAKDTSRKSGEKVKA